MPNWKIHLEVAKRVNDIIKYDDKSYNEFMIGNILPDINNCYLVKDISSKIPHSSTHFYPVHHEGFYEKYKNFFDNPVVVGYYTHLYTDYLWNSDFYSKFKNVNNLSDDDVRILKQKDFKIYNNDFVNNTIKIYDLDELIRKISIIDEVSIIKQDIINVCEYLDKKVIFDEGNYSFYNKCNLDCLLDYTVENIKNKKLKING